MRDLDCGGHLPCGKFRLTASSFSLRDSRDEANVSVNGNKGFNMNDGVNVNADDNAAKNSCEQKGTMQT